MIVLALAEVRGSFEKSILGVEEPEREAGVEGRRLSKPCGTVLGEQGGDSGWHSSPYDTGLL